MDFVHDQPATGSKLRILTVVDTFSRFSPAVVPRFSFRAPDVIEVLQLVCVEVGYPASIRADIAGKSISGTLPAAVGRSWVTASRVVQERVATHVFNWRILNLKGTVAPFPCKPLRGLPE